MDFNNLLSPYEKGISSKNILDFYNELISFNIPMHSILIFRDDSLLSEIYFKPFRKNELHRMFSISKSVTAIAIGILIDKNLIKIEDKIVKYFPEKIHGSIHPYLENMTIKDMLMMRTCHKNTTFNKFDLSSDWVGSFFSSTPTHKSGTVFHYDTSSSHVLAALVEKLSGKKLLDFIKDELPELELSKESYFLTDGQGISMGGSGLMATTLDLLKIGILLMNNGSYNDNQLISADYIKAATSNLTPTYVTAPLPSEGCGYGYMIWRTERNGFVCYGMGGQYIIVNPEERLILVTTSDTQGMPGANQIIYNAYYKHILDKIDKPVSSAKDENAELTLLRAYEASAKLAPVIPNYRTNNSNVENIFSNVGKTQDSNLSSYKYTLSEYHPSSTQSLEAFNELEIVFFDDKDSVLKLTADNHVYELPFSFISNAEGCIPLYEMKCCSNAKWIDDHTLYIKSSVIDKSVGSVHFEIYFEDNGIVLFMRKVEETMFFEYDGHYYGKKLL